MVAEAVKSACFLCRVDEGDPLFREGAFLAKQCACGLIYLDPPADAAAIDPTIDYHDRIYYTYPAGKRLAWLRRFVPEGTLLDIGCGEGEFAAAALEQGYAVDGVDPSHDRADVAERRTGIRVVRALVEDAELPRARYDGIMHVDLLSHFPSPLDSLRAMRASLKRGGVMCFEVGLFGSLGPIWRKLAGRGNFPAHRWMYSEKAVRRLLDETGFEVIGVKHFAIGVSTLVSAAGLKLFPPPELRTRSSLERPIVRGPAGALYYRLQMWLRYDLGAWIPIGGPQTAFFAARPK